MLLVERSVSNQADDSTDDGDGNSRGNNGWRGDDGTCDANTHTDERKYEGDPAAGGLRGPRMSERKRSPFRVSTTSRRPKSDIDVLIYRGRIWLVSL
ncbi:MAG TPA: hypothetical protein VGX96_05790 [Candidatus Elarobacter sp.]|nr:hypothetical protein [Candidatus Elarobacter sp.]